MRLFPGCWLISSWEICHKSGSQKTTLLGMPHLARKEGVSSIATGAITLAKQATDKVAKIVDDLTIR